MKYGLKKDNGYAIYNTETREIISHYRPNEFDQVIKFFRDKKCAPETFCALSRLERKSIEDACKADSLINRNK